MISQLKGLLAHKATDGLTIDVNGVGYEVIVAKTSLENLPATGQPVTLLIHTHVTEGAISLFGFLTPAEKILFRRLISVSGIGPKMALQVLSGLKPNDLIRAILEGNLVRLTAISGIGKKTAERMVMELKDKLIELADISTLEQSLGGESMSPKGLVYQEVLSALVNLGYHKIQAEKVLSGVTIASDSSFQNTLKSALAQLSK